MYFLLVLSTVLAQTPTGPVWPNLWTVSFVEDTYSIIGINQVYGNWYYNSVLGTSRMDRSNGRYDMFCGKNDWFSFFDTPCTQLVNNGNRYLYYPQLQICCNCCSDADGCGIVKPTWLQNATYIGSQMYNGTIPSYNWILNGNEPNIYQETQNSDPLSRQPLELNNGPADRFMLPGAWNTSFSNSVFNVPTYCNPNYMCDTSSICGQVRGSGGKSEFLKFLRG
ncbi:hypothetical protein SteCoe_1594 [Stentor coeruleus]|uniref:Uncharacterized protein n=1 Tax=Stentor coeruleus TaxID=5963 RepID=A0A1R2D1D3_9CILI|nr:hypothetical protein SteCoe_1594 [Stentor coeruleus]